jgi:chaperone required for assembly of F1-ATPase
MPKDTSSRASFDQFFPRPSGPPDPIALARTDLKKSLPRRFYKDARAEFPDGAYVLALDGRAAKTPGGNPLALPCLPAAERLAEEWQAQRELIDPLAMPLTRIVHSAIDGVARHLEATAAEIAKYAGSDLVCYRAAEPCKLAEAQAAAWDRVLCFAREQLGASFICTEGVVFVEQPEAARAAVSEAVARIARSGERAPFALAALHVMTSLTGSVLIALAIAHGELTPAEGWAAAHVDEDFQMQAWGEDPQALERRARAWREMEAAATLWRLTVENG